jgi:hypothetical protein
MHLSKQEIFSAEQGFQIAIAFQSAIWVGNDQGFCCSTHFGGTVSFAKNITGDDIQISHVAITCAGYTLTVTSCTNLL